MPTSVDCKNTFLNFYVCAAPPSLVEWPESVTRPRAGTARFVCVAEGFPTPQITWLKNGEPVHSNGRIKMYNRYCMWQAATLNWMHIAFVPMWLSRTLSWSVCVELYLTPKLALGRWRCSGLELAHLSAGNSVLLKYSSAGFFCGTREG